jgi:hypothetical protein
LYQDSQHVITNLYQLGTVGNAENWIIFEL